MQHIRHVYGIDPTKQGFFWPASEQKRREWLDIKRNRPMEAESTYQCRPGAREGSVFLESDFSYYHAPDGLHEGMASPDVRLFCERGAMVVQAWDTAMSAKSSADHSVCATGLLVSCAEYHRDEDAALLGDCEMHFDVYILDIYRARLDVGDLSKTGRELYRKWQPTLVVVEKKAHGQALMAALENAGIPLEAVDPADNKRKRAVTAIGGAAGSTQGWFRQHRVRVPYPSEAEWVTPYKAEMKDFTGQEGAKDDQVDASVHLVNYAIREGGNGVSFPTGWQSPGEVDKQMTGPGPTDIWAQLNDPDTLEDPFHGLCARCTHYSSPQGRLAQQSTNRPGSRPNFCLWHKRVMPALGTCDDFAVDDDLIQIPRR